MPRKMPKNKTVEGTLTTLHEKEQMRITKAEDLNGRFEQLISGHEQRLYEIAFSVLHETEDARDAVQNGVQVIFLHRGSASKDGTEQDGAFHQRQWRKKRKRPVLSG